MDFDEINKSFINALKKTAKIKDINSACKLLSNAKETDLNDPKSKDLIETLDKCFSSQNFLKSEKQRKFLSNLVLLFIFRISELTLTIKKALQSINQQNSTCLGDVFVNAWLVANASERAMIKTTLLKEVIDFALLSASPKYAKNCRMFLNAFHAKRRKNQLYEMMVLLYEPIIFRYLHATNPIVRQNALLLFVSAFPLESPQFSKEKNLVLLDTQISEIKLTLEDESPKVRSEAAKLVCRILYEWWDLIPNQARQDFITTLTTKLAFDASSSTVRCSVLEGIDFLLARAESIELIIPNLKKLGYLLHDPVENVRIQFIKLLTTINPFNDINIFAIVHVDHLIYRMKYDTKKCYDAICQLLYNSLFPQPLKKNKEKSVNTKRVARCIFLMQRSLIAAEKFYSCLPKYVSIDELLTFLRFAYFYSDKVMNGNEPKLPDVRLASNDDDMLLPGFEDGNDLEKQNLKPEQAIWVIISAIIQSISKIVKDSEQLEEIKDKSFPDFHPEKILPNLPPEIHSYFFKFLSLFKSTKVENELTLEYLQSDNNIAWDEALRCLIKWNSIESYFQELVNVISNVFKSKDNIKIEELTRAVHFISFIFSHSELCQMVINQIEVINTLNNDLNQFVPIMLNKLNLPYEEENEMPPNIEKISYQLPDQSLIQILELLIALRVHLAIQVLRDGDDKSYEESCRISYENIFLPFVQGILSIPNKEITKESLTFKVYQTLMTLFSDMISLHILGETTSFEAISFYESIIDKDNDYNDIEFDVAFDCLSKICMSLAIDAKVNNDEVHPAHPIIIKMITSAHTEESINISKHLIQSLTKTHLKKKSLYWFIDTLSELFVDEEKKKETKEEEEEYSEDEKEKSIKSLYNLINETIVKLSNE